MSQTIGVTATAKLPPGPGLLRATGFVRAPFAFLDACARDYGDWFTLRVPGLPPFVFTSDPSAIQEVFAGDPEALHAGEANAPLGAFMGPQSVLFLDGAAHLRARRLVLAPFHGDRMQAYGRTVQEIADAAIADWPLGKRFPIHRSMQDIAFEVILRVVFGFDEAEQRARLRRLLRQLFALYNSPVGSVLGVPLLQWNLGPLSPWGRVVRLKREIDAVLFPELARRRTQDGADRSDVLSLLLGARDDDGNPMSNEQLRDELLTLMLAGHETTAASLAWVLYHVLQTPEVSRALHEELERSGATAGAIEQLPYLDAVIKETSRLTPVVPNVARKLQIAMRVGGRDLPAGVLIAPCIYLTHRRPDLWPDPERFDPRRFLGARITPSSFFPFGGGVRRCLGAAFATHEMKIVLARVMTLVDLALVPGYRVQVLRRSIAFAPSEGLPVIARRRD